MFAEGYRRRSQMLQQAGQIFLLRGCISVCVFLVTIALCAGTIAVATQVGDSEQTAFAVCGGLLVTSGAASLFVLVDLSDAPSGNFHPCSLPVSCCVPSSRKPALSNGYTMATEVIAVAPSVLFASAVFWCDDLSDAGKIVLACAPVALFAFMRALRIIPRRNGVAFMDSLLLVQLFYVVVLLSHRGFYRSCSSVLCRIVRNPYGVVFALDLWIVASANAFATVRDLQQKKREEVQQR